MQSDRQAEPCRTATGSPSATEAPAGDPVTAPKATDSQVTGAQSTGAPAPGVPHAVFSVDGVGPRERYDIWHDSIACIFDVDARPDVRKDDFNAKVDAHMLGPLMLARTSTRNQVWQRTSEVMARDGMDHYMIQLFESGDMRWSTPAGDRTLPENGLVVFDLTQPVTSTTDDFTNLSLIVPRPMLEPQLQAPGAQHLRTLDAREPMVALLRDHMVSLKRLAQRMTGEQAATVAPSTVGLAAACLNGALVDRTEQVAGVQMAQLACLRRLIEANLSNPRLSADWLAKRGGVSRSKLYTLFEPFDGVANYIRERRLRRALLQLTNRLDAPPLIYRLAADAGYTSEAAFTRAFTARYGVAPSEVRRSGRVADKSKANTEGLDRRYEDWLVHLSI
jgi:AraC-like DNA-binding protein